VICLVGLRKRAILGRKSSKAAFYILRILESDKAHVVRSCDDLEERVFLLCKENKRAAEAFGFKETYFDRSSWVFKYTLGRLRREGLVEFEDGVVGGRGFV